MTGRSTRETILLSAAHTPNAKPIVTVISVATSTCESVSIAGSHMPRTPIEASIANVVSAGRRPESTNAMAVNPARVTSQGVSTRNCWRGNRTCSMRKLPAGSVTLKRNAEGFCT